MPKLYENNLQKDIAVVKEEFLNSTYTKQVAMYNLALELEYYELLSQLVKLLPELPEEFLEDVEKCSIININ